MNWIAPIAGLVVAAATIPPLLALYFLRLRRARRTISSTMLWTRATEDLRANAPFQRLRLSILLLLQLLALALVALAIAQPYADLGVRGAQRVVLLIDRSGSMNAQDGGVKAATRVEEAKRIALERVRDLHGGGIFSGAAPEIAVIAFAGGAEVLAPYTDNAAQVRDAISGIRPTDDASRIGEALELARAFTAVTRPDDPDARPAAPPVIELISDGRIEDLSEQVLREGERLAYRPVGSADAANAGVASVAAARDPDRPEQVQVFARLVNWGAAPRRTDVALIVDGDVRGLTPEPVEIPARVSDQRPGESQVGFPAIPLPRAGVIGVRIDADDALAHDDIAHVVAAAPRALRIALVGRGAFAIKSALEGLAPAELRTFSLAEWESATSQDTTLADRFDAVVLDGAVPARLDRGRYLSFAVVPPLAGFEPYGNKESVVVRSTRDEHPLLRYVNLDGLWIGSMVAVAAGADAETVVDASEGAVVLAQSRGPVALVCVTFDPMESNWPFQRSFVNFVANAVDWLAANGRPITEEALRPGDALAARLPSEATRVTLTQPDDTRMELTVADPSSFAWGPARRAGVYVASWGSGDAEAVQSFAVNLDSAREGRIDTVPELTVGTEQVAGQSSPGASRTALWPWLILAAVAVLLLEWWVWLRRS
jgi:hypothetical protein